ncbi:MAG: threonine aldolase family protein [Trueperaceae bacterium]
MKYNILMKIIDLRSDTVTKPTPAMRKAMAEAEVGDDVYGEDPTVNRLQDMLAERTGFEAALFFPSGSQSNQAALAVHTKRGDEVVAPVGAHIYEYEMGAMAVVSGLVPRLIPAPLGVPSLDDIRGAIHFGIHQSPTGLITLENTHNKAGGTVVPHEHCWNIRKIADEFHLPYHLDGARGFNAVVAQGITLEAFCKPFDSVSLCLSKGLAAPVGTVLVGSKAFIKEAHRYRKMLGGGMRQAGILAAAGIVAIETMIDRLAEDHSRAHLMAESLATLPGISVDLASVQTNLVYFKVDNANDFANELQKEGILCNILYRNAIRLVTHYEISDADIADAVNVIAKLAENRQAVKA